MKTRSDKFRPSVINPAEFKFIGHHYIGGMSDETWEALCDEINEGAEALAEHQAAHPGFTVAGHKWPGQCDCCGARYKFGATFHTETTNTYISIGSICAGKMNMGNPAAMKTFREQVNTWKLHQERVAKARAYLTTVGLVAMLTLFLDKDNTSREFPEVTLRDMCGKVIGWGNELSEKQQAFARKLLQQIADRPRLEAERAAKDANRQPVPVTDKRLTVRGTIIGAEYREGGYSSQGFYQPSCVKIVVEATEGYKVWGTAAGELTDAVLEFSDKSYLSGDEQAALLKGKRVQFDARLTPSDKDTKFGFFKRPTKARILDVAPPKANPQETPCSAESLPA